jgi:CIC family chloride channel protein
VSAESDEKSGQGGASLLGWPLRLMRRVSVRLGVSAMREKAQAFFRRHLVNEAQLLFGLTIVIGVVCGLAAVAFHIAIHAAEGLMIDRAIHVEGSSWMVWTILSPALGGLLAGPILTWIVPGARGSGIPQVKQAFAVEGGRVKFRDAVGKFLIGVLQIGSGASLGLEGPTVQICAGATSLLGRATSLPPRNMRRLTPVGVAAGIAAAFNAPIAAVTFTIEEVVGTLDQAVLSGVVIAAAVAAVIERGILGVHPVIEVTEGYTLNHPSSIALYALLGVAAAFVSIAFTDGLLKLRLWFRTFRLVPSWAHPAVGGLVTGILAVLALRFLGTTGITGGGYHTLGRALDGQLTLVVLAILCGAKLVATVFSYSSGGAGGIFAPALFMGAMLGGTIGHLDVLLMHHETRQVGAFALVGMGAVFAGIIRAPITSVLIIFEMTGGYGLVLPLMLANATSYVLARRLRPTPVYEALLEQDGVILPHATPIAHAREQLLVSDAMTPHALTVRAGQSLAQAMEIVGERKFSKLPVVDDKGLVLGVLSTEELRNGKTPPSSPVTSLMKSANVIRSNAPLLGAIVRMNDLRVRQLTVVDPETQTKLVGILAMSDLVRAHTVAAPLARSITSKVSLFDALSELHAEAIMVPSAVVPAAAKLSDLSARLREGAAQALVVPGGDHGFGVVLPEHLTAFSHDEELEKMLIAVDFARPASSASENAPLSSLARAMASNNTEAVVVLDTDSVPVGVVTKSALALAFLDSHVCPPSSQGPGAPA